MTKQLLQFVPFSSALDTNFWWQLTEKKLDTFKLDDRPVKIHGFYTNKTPPGLPAFANIDYNAFSENYEVPRHHFPLSGILYNMNTLEDFKKKNKTEILNQIGSEIWDDIKSGEAIKDPSRLLRFLCYTFADLKKYKYIYWLAFPALCFPQASYIIGRPMTLTDCFNEEQIKQLQIGYDQLENTAAKAFFLVFVSSSQEVSVHELREYEDIKSSGEKVMLAFADPSSYHDHPGWPLRNLLTLVAYHWIKDADTWDIICFRETVKEGVRSCSHSIVLQIELESTDELPEECPACVGWEKNEKRQLGPRTVNLSRSMDPIRLAENAVDLNLKLMRWRLEPSLDLEKISSAKCLLLGAGTLGCNVARCLMAWGVKTITFVDNGSVSYSNPVRQSLYSFADCLQGGKPKAEAAAEALRRIFPGVETHGVCLSIPMPGHPIPEHMSGQTLLDVQQLESLVDSHDVVFLLMDTRESRWLPTVLCAAKGKLAINAALGFDTYLVQRHGARPDHQEEPFQLKFDKPVPGSRLGCYYCNDVVAPGNSTIDRTLDQQCTVTRPGVSFIASSLAVELMVCVLQHPDGMYSAAEPVDSEQHLEMRPPASFGIVPHQIRGFVSYFHQIQPVTVAFEHCTACSRPVLEAYKTRGFEFLMEVFNNPDYLKELTGLKQILERTDESEIWEYSDDEST